MPSLPSSALYRPNSTNCWLWFSCMKHWEGAGKNEATYCDSRHSHTHRRGRVPSRTDGDGLPRSISKIRIVLLLGRRVHGAELIAAASRRFDIVNSQPGDSDSGYNE